jgi:DNA-binding response OmpR family regulator
MEINHMVRNTDNSMPLGDLSQEVSVAEKSRPRILVAEDDDAMRKLLLEALRAEDYDVTECRDGAEFLLQFEAFFVRGREVDFDVIISDILMPGLTGLEILEDARHYDGFPPMILITAFGDQKTRARAVKSGAAAIFDKPFEIDELLGKVRELTRPQLSSK